MRMRVASVGTDLVWMRSAEPTEAVSQHHQFAFKVADLPTGPRGRKLRVGDVLDVPTSPAELVVARADCGFVSVAGVSLLEAVDA